MTPTETQEQLSARISEALEAAFPDIALEMQPLPKQDISITLPPEKLEAVVAILIETFDFYHLSTITGVDNGETIEILYHFWNRYGVTLRVHLPYDAPHVPALTPTIPGAAFYEREIREMLGVVFEGLPEEGPLLLADDWEAGLPLRKISKQEKEAV